VIILGKKVSRWWLSLFVPLFLIALPFILLLPIIVGNVAHGFFGPPAIWNRPRNLPPISDLVGNYVESEQNWEDKPTHIPATLHLNTDGSMTVQNLPYMEGEARCTMTGSGKWQQGGTSDHHRVFLIFTPSHEGSSACKAGEYAAFELAGHSAPYSLYWVLDDPDLGMGVWMKRKK
jgi:hypothetical protein